MSGLYFSGSWVRFANFIGKNAVYMFILVNHKGTIDLPLELSENETLKLMQSEMQNPQRINMAKKLYDQYDQLGNEFHYQSAVKTNIK